MQLDLIQEKQNTFSARNRILLIPELDFVFRQSHDSQ